RGSPLCPFFARRVEGHSSRLIHTRFIRRARRTFHLDVAESRISNYDRAAHAQESEAQHHRQRKPRNGQASSAMMFRSDGHIVRLKARFVPPKERASARPKFFFRALLIRRDHVAMPPGVTQPGIKR